MSSAMECPRCKEIEFHHFHTAGPIQEYRCDDCGHYETHQTPNYTPVLLRNQAE